MQREGAAIEARLNATDGALQPAAGGVMVSWSDPIEGEIRDDQGICIKNPDTGLFMRYRLAGAYDSNIALLLATGMDREASWAQIAEVLRRTPHPRHRPGDQPRVPPRVDEVVSAPRRVGQADDRVRRARI